MDIRKLAHELDGKLQVAPRGYGKHIPLIESYFKKIEENKQPTRKQGFQVFTMCFISLIVGMMYGSIDDMYVTLANQIGLIILGFVIFGLLLVCFKWFSKSVKGGKK